MPSAQAGFALQRGPRRSEMSYAPNHTPPSCLPHKTKTSHLKTFFLFLPNPNSLSKHFEYQRTPQSNRPVSELLLQAVYTRLQPVVWTGSREPRAETPPFRPPQRCRTHSHKPQRSRLGAVCRSTSASLALASSAPLLLQ